jgi:hypothetical protein
MAIRSALWAAVLVGAIVSSARAQGLYRPRITVEETTKWRIVLVDLGDRAADSTCAGRLDAADPVITKTSNSNIAVLSLAVTTVTPSWLYQGDAPADLQLDSTIVRLEPGTAPRRRVTSYSTPARETGTYAITPEQLLRLATARRAALRVTGSGGACTFAIGKKDQVVIRAFLRAEYATTAIAVR